MGYSAIDLFCGCGGLSLGLERAGFDVLFAADNWPVATATYGLNFIHPILTVDLGDVTAERLRKMASIGDTEVDLVIGGPPCQGFSIQRIGEDHDTRNNLVLRFGQLVVAFRPRMFLMENVPGLLGKRGRVLAEAFREKMSTAGYEMDATIVNAAAYGVAQIRRRVIFTGWRRGEARLDLPKQHLFESEYVSVWEAIGDLPPPPKDLTPHPSDALHRRTRLSALNQRRIEIIPPGGGMEDLPVDLRVNCHKNGADRIGHRYVYGRLAPEKPAGTITARFDSFTRGKFGHPKEPRNITLREGARLQSFPDSFRFVGTQEEIAAQIGNAVPPLLAEALARAAAQSLSRRSTVSNSTARIPNSQFALFESIGGEV